MAWVTGSNPVASTILLLYSPINIYKPFKINDSIFPSLLIAPLFKSLRDRLYSNAISQWLTDHIDY